MTTAPATLQLLAQRFDAIALHTQGRNYRRALKNAAQLRLVATLTTNGTYTTEQAWQWADAAAGQLTDDKHQLEKKGKR